MSIEPIVAHHPARHPYLQTLWPQLAACGYVGDFWDAGALQAAGVNVVQVHFGFEQLHPEALAAWIGSLPRHRIGLVHTAHDLDNPHLTDQRTFHRNVELLVAAASTVHTLTPAAAKLIEERYGRRAVVTAHPNIVPAGWSETAPSTIRHGIYVHAGTCRPNLDLAFLERLAAGERPVIVHARPSAPAAVLRRLRKLAKHSGMVLDIRPRLSNESLFARLATSEVVALPYRWGTHSGLLEAAHDLGTPVVAPAFGGFGDQGAITVATLDALPEAVERAIRTPPDVSPELRAAQRQHSRAAHARIHRLAREVSHAGLQPTP